MEALGVPYTLRYSGHCSPHLCVAEEEFPEVTNLAEALRSNEQLISDLGRRLNPYGAIYLWPIARLPFSLNENTGFACLEVASPTAGAFEPSQAHPEQVQIATAWPPEQGRLGARPLLEWARGEREVEPTPVSLFTSAAPTPASVRRREDCESDWTRSRCVLREKMRSADASLANAPPAPAGMTLIPAGPFITGTPWTTYELGQPPLSIVELGAFFLDLTPVTSAQYQVFIDDRGYRRQELWSPEGWAFLQAAGWEGPMAPCTEGPPDLPARGLSAFEAEAYARWAGKRIPTFAEWEKACRGIDGRRWPGATTSMSPDATPPTAGPPTRIGRPRLSAPSPPAPPPTAASTWWAMCGSGSRAGSASAGPSAPTCATRAAANTMEWSRMLGRRSWAFAAPRTWEGSRPAE